MAEADGVSAETAIRTGVPHEEIRAYAGETDAGAIVIGARGRSAFTGALLGSTVDATLRHADRGLAAYLLFATGISMTGTTDPGSLEGLRLAASGVVATTLTAGGMLATDTRHPPACATTLIVSLGLLSTLLEGAIIILAVVLLVVTHRLLLATERLGVRYTKEWQSK